MNAIKQQATDLALKSFKLTSLAVSMALLLTAGLVVGVWATIHTLALLV